MKWCWAVKEIRDKIGVDLAQCIVDIGFAASKSEARRHIKGGAVSLGGIKVQDPFARLGQENNAIHVIESLEFMSKEEKQNASCIL